MTTTAEQMVSILNKSDLCQIFRLAGVENWVEWKLFTRKTYKPSFGLERLLLQDLRKELLHRLNRREGAVYKAVVEVSLQRQQLVGAAGKRQCEQLRRWLSELGLVEQPYPVFQESPARREEREQRQATDWASQLKLF